MNQPYLNLGKPLGVWIWGVADLVTSPEKFLDFSLKNKITEMYFSINGNVSNQDYVNLIDEYNSHGIRACALTGDPAWILKDRRRAYYNYLERVGEINALCKGDHGFASLHLDVEPHVLPEAKEKGMQNYVEHFVDLIKDARKQADDLGIKLEWDIPSWFWKFDDHEHQCKLNETLFIYCDAVGIMAYFDSASGQTDKALPNVEIAKKYSKPILIGTETMDLDEARRPDGNCAISYFEEGKHFMYSQLEIIKKNINEVYDNFGFAIHHMHSWMDLQNDFLPQYERKD